MMDMIAMSVLSLVSKVLAVEDAVAVAEHLVALDAQVEVLSDVAHVEQLLVVLLQQAAWGERYTGLIQR